MSDFYYRVLIRFNEGTTFEGLTTEQREAIASVLGQYRLPMPGTNPALGKVVCDCLAADNFDPATMPGLGLGDWEIIGMWESDGTVVTPLDEAKFIPHLPLTELLTPPPLYEPHRWAGWPQLF